MIQALSQYWRISLGESVKMETLEDEQRICDAIFSAFATAFPCSAAAVPFCQGVSCFRVWSLVFIGGGAGAMTIGTGKGQVFVTISIGGESGIFTEDLGEKLSLFTAALLADITKATEVETDDGVWSVESAISKDSRFSDSVLGRLRRGRN